MTQAGFLHSGTHGSTLLCSSPWRFVAYTPFIGFLSLGIRRIPFVAYKMAKLFLVWLAVSGKPLADFPPTANC